MKTIELRRPRATSQEKHIRQWYAKNGADRRFKAAATASGELEISILGVIGESYWEEGITAKGVKKALDANPNVTTVRVLIDSPGGDAFMGIAIQALLKRSAAKVHVEIVGEASSAASIIAMAGDTITMHEGSMMMIHRAASWGCGFAEDLRQTAVVLDKLTGSVSDLYVARTGKTREEIDALVTAETWMSAREAVSTGFADNMAPAKTKAAEPAPLPGPGSPAPEEDDEDEEDDVVIIVVPDPVVKNVATDPEPAPKTEKEKAMATKTPMKLSQEELELIAKSRSEAVLEGKIDLTPEEVERIAAERAKARESARINQPTAKAVRPEAPALGGMRI